MDPGLNHLILDIYGEAQAEPVADFSVALMARLNQVVGFDSSGSILLHVNEKGQAIITAHSAYNVVPNKAALRAEYIGVENYSAESGLTSRDPLLRRSLAQPGRVHTLASGDTGDHVLVEYAHLTESFHALNFVTRKSDRTIASFSFWRAGRQDAFSQADIAQSAILIPHALQAIAINRQLAAAPFSGSGPRSGILIAEANGLIHHLDENSILLLRREYPDWLSYHLPQEMVEAFLSGSAQRFVGRHIIASLRRQGALMVVGLQAREAGRKLTPAELRVVEKIAEHGTYKEAARQLGVSPSTVRNQLHAIYQKLGISSKSELLKALDP